MQSGENSSGVVLGSASPRRRELMASVLTGDSLTVVPPNDGEERGFADCVREDDIELRLEEIVRTKLQDVCGQLASQAADEPAPCVICADTIVVAQNEGDTLIVLGKPPAEHWQPVVRDWFLSYYQNKPHEVWTMVFLAHSDGIEKLLVKTRVTLSAFDEWWLDWYLSTEESVGKAGGYAIQGAAAAMIESVDGSLTNVIGLPVFEVTTELRRLGILRSQTGPDGRVD